MSKLTPFVEAYIVAALWSSITDDGTPLDSLYCTADVKGETLEKAIKDCEKFQNGNKRLLTAYLRKFTSTEAGHDFWLSRNGHGSGFFDRCEREGYVYDVCQELQEKARDAGSRDLYIGDDKELYFF